MKKLAQKVLMTLLVISSCALIFNNFFLLSKDLIYGDGSGEKIIPQPLYGFARIYNRENTIKYNAVHRLAADYAQIYFSSQEFTVLSRNYDTGYLDPWKRPSRYAPFVHYVCAILFCKLDYGYASFLHMLIQLLLFFAFFVFSFKLLNMASNLGLGLWLVSLLLFATPAGLLWFAQGQFSLYVAISYLLLLLGLLKNKPALVFLSSLFAYIKWTAYPFVFTVFVVFILSAKNKKEAAHNILFGLLYVLPIALLSLAFRSKFIHFLKGIYLQERYVQPEGISLSLLLPAVIVKLLPLILILLGCVILYRNGRTFVNLLPFFIGVGVISLTYPTIAFEYSIPCVLGLLPFVFYWTKNGTRADHIARWGFILFLFLVSWTEVLLWFVSGGGIVTIYVIVSVIFFIVAALYPGGFLSSSDINVVKLEARL